MAKGFSTLLRSHITTFDAGVKKLLRESGLATEFSGVHIFEDNGEKGCALMASLQGLPQRPGSKKNSENVFVTAKLTGRMKDGHLHLTEYGTEIGYFRQTNASTPLNDLEPITGYHYDFDCDGKKLNHPIFHAQPKISAGDRYLGMKPGITHRPYPEYKEIRTIRIPTPQMDVFSAIVMILADHVVEADDPKGNFRQFLDRFEQNMIKFDLDCVREYMSKSFLDSGPHRVQLWYPKPLPKKKC